MAFPNTTLRLAPVLDSVSGAMNGLKQFAIDRRQRMLAGNVGSDLVLEVWHRLYSIRANLQTWAAVPGIGPYAQAQFGDDELDIAAEFQSVVAAITAVINNIESTFPKDAGGYLLAVQFGAGVFTQRQFTPAQLATLAGLLNTLIGTIE